MWTVFIPMFSFANVFHKVETDLETVIFTIYYSERSEMILFFKENKLLFLACHMTKSFGCAVCTNNAITLYGYNHQITE